MKKKFKIQNNQYEFPYHHLVSFDSKFETKEYKYLSWGTEYYSYVSYVINGLNLNLKNVAEVGCGDGKILIELAKKNPNFIFEGYDLSKKAILFANAFSSLLKNISFFDKDFKISKKKFNLVLCVEVLEHIPEIEIPKFIETINSKLVKGGNLLISVPTINQKLHPKHYRHYDLNLLKNQTKKFFKIKKINYFYSGNKFGMKLINFLLKNKLYILTNSFLRNTLFKFYNKFYRNSNETLGFHIVVLLEKK